MVSKFAGLLGVSCAAPGSLAPGKGEGLTLYRIGAPFPADEPLPEEVERVHLSWAEATAGFDDGWKVLDMEEDGISPVFLEPGGNISLDAAGLGGGPSGAKWPVKTHNEFHDWTVDGDPNTAFEEAHFLETGEGPFIGVDLGGILPIYRVVFYPSPDESERYVGHFALFLFDGDYGALAPGVYLYLISVDADSRRAGRSGVVTVAY